VTYRALPSLLVLSCCFFFPNTAPAQSSNLDGFAQCLAEKKITMCGSFLCRHCDDQKRLFGSSFRLVPYVECSTPGSHQLTFLCMAEKVQFTPTWILADGNRLVGLQSLKTLSDKPGCKLP
jgi:hypothetical protein